MAMKSRYERFPAIILLAVVASLLLADPSRAKILDSDPLQVPSGQRGAGTESSYPSDELGYRFLSTREALNGPLGELYKTFRQLKEEGHTPKLSVSYFMQYPDGSRHLVRLKSFSDLEQLLTRIKERHESYADLIRKIRSEPLRSNYTAIVSSECPKDGFVNGKVRVRPDGIAFRLKQKERTFPAVTIGSTVTVLAVLPNQAILSLTGASNGYDVDLEDAASSCEIRLVPDENTN